ncbi:MAG TPA: prolyl oligopeptidase family serine peptidase [Pirellulales bacterium]
MLSISLCVTGIAWAAEPSKSLAAPQNETKPTEEKDEKKSSASTPPAAKPHEQSEAIKAFRKTAVSLTYPSGDLKLPGWIYKPAGDGPFPVVIWNHGSEQRPTAHPELGKFYTEHGYVLFLPVRHGHGEAPGDYIVALQDKHRAEIDDLTIVQRKAVELHEVYNRDVVAAVKWIREQPFVDPKRLAISGCSYGGIQTLLASEQDLHALAFVVFSPGAMSWANPELRKREALAVERARGPMFLLQAKNDYSIGPSEVLGPLLRDKKGLNQAMLYPAFGETHQDGHGGFACWEEGIAVWGNDVLQFLEKAGMQPK